MKSLSIALLFTLSIAFALASPAPDAAAAAVPEKEQKATTECNATNPVQQNPREKIAVVVATGQKAQFSHEEKCFLNCFLQKVGFFDENSNIKNGSGLIKYTVKQAPELAKYSDVLIAQIFQISRSTKHFEDKCQKAFVVYHQFAQGVFTLAVAEGLQSLTGIKEKIINAVENGQNVDQDIQKQVQQYLTFFDALVTAFAQESQKKISVIMNSLQIVLVFSLSITFAFADPPSQSQSPVVLEDKDKKATEECNATIPVQRHTRTVLGSAIATGSTFRLTQDEKCFLNCFLQKVGFLDANTSSIRNGPGLVNYTLRHSPELVKYSDVLIAQIFQINRVTRGFTDNCFKAYLIYHQFAQNIFVLAIADGLQSYSGVKDKLTTATQTGQDVNPDLSKQINEFLGFFDTLVTSIAKEAP